MARCELSGKRPQVKNLVSHSNRKTKSIHLPNIQKKRLFSRALDEMITLRIATRTLKSIEHVGGLDTFILRQPLKDLSVRALRVRKKIENKIQSGHKK